MRWMLCSLLWALSITYAVAGIIYLNPNSGNDSYTGASAAFTGGLNGPKKSIIGGMLVATKGDTLMLGKGIYGGSNNNETFITDSITIMGINRDSVIVDATNNDYCFNVLSLQGAIVKDVTFENLTIRNAREAAILVERTFRFTAKNLLIYSTGMNSQTHPNSDGIRILGSNDFLVSGLECHDMAQTALVLGGGCFDGLVENLDIYRVGNNLFSAGVAIWTSAGVTVPAANVDNIHFQGNITMDSVSNGFLIEAEQNKSVTITANANASFSRIPNADVIRYGAGTTPSIENFVRGLDLGYKGYLGLVTGLQAYFADLLDMIAVAQTPLYEPDAVLMDLDEGNFYVAGNMDVSLALFRAEDNDTLHFYPGNYDDLITVTKSLVLKSIDPVTVLENLTLDGTGIVVRLMNDFHIGTSLQLDNGVIETSDTTGIIKQLAGTGLTVTGETSFIDGPYEVENTLTTLRNMLLPLGKDGKYHPIWLNLQQANNNLTTYTGELLEAAAPAFTLPASIGNVSPDRYWEVSSDGASGIAALTVRIDYFVGDNINDPSDLRIVQNDGSNADWIDLGGTGNNYFEGHITSNNITTLGTFTLANRVGGTNFDPNSNGGVGIRELDNTTVIDIAPNPAKNHSVLQLDMEQTKEVTIDLYDITGKHMSSIFQGNLPGGSHTIHLDVERLSPGIYILQVQSNNGTATKRLVIQ